MNSASPKDPVEGKTSSAWASLPFRKKLVLVASGMFLLSIVFPPVKYGSSEVTVRFLDEWKLITEMGRGQSLNWGVLFIEWVLLAGICWLVLYLRSGKSSD